MRGLETLGRVRLSKYFFLRDFLYSEIAALHGFANIPDDPDLAIAAGTRLATDCLDPLVETFGPIHIRSAYRHSDLNAFGNANRLNCASNSSSRAGHIWDQRDADGHMGATACIVIPWFADRYAQGRHWHDLAWWLHDHVPCSALEFFPKLCAVNLTWSERPGCRISGWIGGNSVLLRRGDRPSEAPEARAARCGDFPPFRAIRLP